MPFDNASSPSLESGSSEAAGDEGAEMPSRPEVGPWEDRDKGDCSELLSSQLGDKGTDGTGP
eukprot:CAMPEP_0194304062 /NCGR_PEP_ID=MMETSP0171-20130528/1858_1 /TAXON_ID=218684 /ORGANISM="Corethron pennatum, Strain L29A3" /LENGTH=61 /DNA_ID=CAMNT_0039055185 /DNA_START=858 /DNA_END=1043 /DNA_ORIENTATION=-